MPSENVDHERCSGKVTRPCHFPREVGQFRGGVADRHHDGFSTSDIASPPLHREPTRPNADTDVPWVVRRDGAPSNATSGRNLLDLGGLRMDLRDLLGHDVDVVSESRLRPRVVGRVSG